jgi:hypothetical protein
VVKYILVLLMAIASGTAGAQVYKCKGADGKLQFSDTRCKAGHTLEIVPDHTSYVTPQQRLEAQQAGSTNGRVKRQPATQKRQMFKRPSKPNS